MTYEEALQKINSRLRFGIKPGLERIEALCKKLGDPQKKPRFVHVAGTNGKGTTCTLIASVLTAAGYRTGLYTSPYVLDFRERFRIDGEMIPEAELIEEVKRVSPVADELEAAGDTVTEFEFITALAFDWFAQRDCDFVVLEVGLGGRFDATNVIDTPEAAAIASISLDHTAILGDTYAKIAFEKAGIIKKGGDVVLYPVQEPSVFETIESACNERGAHLHIPDEKNMQVNGTALTGTALTWRGLPLTLPWILSKKPLVLLDGGQNPGCASALHEVLKTHLSGRHITAIMGMMADKDSMRYLELTAPHFERIITVQPQNPRSLSAEALADEAKHFCKDVQPAQSMKDAIEKATVSGDEVLVICGSFFLASEIRDLAIEKYKA